MNTKAKTSAHVVLGLDKEGKPRAALIHPADLEAATKAAASLGFKIGRADSPQVLQLATQLPDAKVFATGNLIYAPGRYIGYDVTALPGVTEAITEERWDDVPTYVGLTAGAINAYSAKLQAATAILGSAGAQTSQ